MVTPEEKAAHAATQSSLKQTASHPEEQAWIICRVCGYIEDAKYRDQPCPACGFPPTVWMDYKPRRLSKKRGQLLDLHLHPICVHFPIVATTGSFFVPIIALLIPSIADTLFGVVTLVTMILPFLVLAGGISGYIGGKLRYKTVSAKYLKQKIYLSIAYFILSCVQSYLAYTQGVQADNAWIMIILGIIGSILAAKLGKMGSYLFAGRFSPYTAG